MISATASYPVQPPFNNVVREFGAFIYCICQEFDMVSLLNELYLDSQVGEQCPHEGCKDSMVKK